jgi:hypothetical protein
LVVALPLHYMGHFNYDWVSHLGPIYVCTIIFVGSCGGPDWTEPSGADAGTSQAVVPLGGAVR